MAGSCPTIAETCAHVRHRGLDRWARKPLHPCRELHLSFGAHRDASSETPSQCINPQLPHSPFWPAAFGHVNCKLAGIRDFLAQAVESDIGQHHHGRREVTFCPRGRTALKKIVAIWWSDRSARQEARCGRNRDRPLLWSCHCRPAGARGVCEGAIPDLKKRGKGRLTAPCRAPKIDGWL